jgi:hypothetical protein
MRNLSSSNVLFGHNANVVVYMYSVPLLVHWEQPMLKTDMNVLLMRQELLCITLISLIADNSSVISPMATHSAFRFAVMMLNTS